MARYPPLVIEPGTRYGELTIVREVDKVGYSRRFLCRCSCGNETIAFLGNLRAKRTTSCGCVGILAREASRHAIIEGRRLRALVSDEGRICLTCGEWKPWSRFAADKRRASGKTSNCVDCGGWRSIKAMYGVSKAQWHELLESQGGVCALCHGENTRDRRFEVDHNHACCGPTKACPNCIRGLLCHTCNRVIGFVEGKPKLEKLLAFYLDQRPLLPGGYGGDG
jgi:hypothetical protein